ncbi:MAG: NAD(P)-dependent oxidoreductase [Ignavibacteriaceae bacterium]
MKTLVTGGSGFIGSHVVERLCDKGMQVKCLSKDRLFTNDLTSLNVEIISGDLNGKLDWESILYDVNLIYHIAGVTRAKNYKEYYEGNFQATKNFIETCSTCCNNLKRFVYVSSLTAVGPSLETKPVDENSDYHPVSDYGKSKMLAELEVLKFRNKIPITILRPSAVYGPRERDMYMYMKSIKRGVQMLIGFDKKYLNLIYATDLADGIIASSLNQTAEDQVYFLGSEDSYPNEIIGETIASILHKNAINLHIPHCMVFAICGIEELMGKIFNKNVFLNIQKAREITQSKWTCSIEKAKRDFNFIPKISLYEGFLNTFNWYKRMGWM